MYEFTCSTFVFFILNLVEIDFLLKDKLEPSKVTPYDILKYIKKDEIKFIAEGKLHDYYYQIKGIEHDDSIIRYSFSSEKTEKQSISILNDKVRIFPMYNEERKSIVTEDGKFNNKVNIEDLKDHKGVSGVIRNKKNQILLLYHNKFNGWTLPMGKVKNGENLYDALCSELNEELGIDVVSATEITNFEKSYVTNGAVQKIDHHIFEINLFNGSPKNLEKTKHKNMIWLSYDNIITLKNKLDPLKALVNKLGGSNIYYNLNESGKPFILYETPITEKEKENLPDSDFGYKDKSGKRHFPLHDANHVRSAN
jgi:8-oxo-dGTP pyrophosphatase MutT (NUDIX family)